METGYKRQRWVNIGICFLMIFVGLGFCSANKGLFLSAICNALSLKRTVFSLSTSCRFIATSIVNIFFGALVARFGTKKLMLTGFVFLIAAMLLGSAASSISLFVLAEICSGIGFSFTGTAMVGCVVNRWSPESKGSIMGAILCANGMGGAIAAQIITPLIYNENNIFGYRDAYRLIALLLAGMLVVVLLFFREKPKGDASSATVSKKKARGQSWEGVPFAAAKRMPCFYLVLICIFFTGFCLQGISGIAAAHMRDVGLDAGFIAAISSLSLLSLTGAKFLTGVLYDRVGLRKTITLCCSASIVCMLALSCISPSPAGKVLTAVYSVLASLALPLETVMLPLYASDLFGNHSFDRIMGLFISVNTAGYAVGTPFVNMGFDLTGSYVSVLLCAAGIMLAVTITMQFVITAAHRLRSAA